MYFFVADQHFGHKNIIKYCNRPFNSVEEMDTELIKRHNEVVGPKDITVHGGDFAFTKKFSQVLNITEQLNGEHIFLRGSHDHWMKTTNKYFHEIWEHSFNGQLIVVCHYAMRTWAASHYNSWHLYGHSHGELEPVGKSWDIGVDNNNFYPLSFDQIKKIMANRPDNPNLVKSKWRK